MSLLHMRLPEKAHVNVNVNVNNLLAISRLDFDNSGMSGFACVGAEDCD